MRVLLLLLGLMPSVCFASPVTIPHVPEYTWTYGCSPTAGAEVLGYFDLNGYENLFAASGWDQVSLTTNVTREILELAGYMGTNVSNGATWSYNISPGMVRYVAAHGYTCTTATVAYSLSAWSLLTGYIDEGAPILAAVDSNGDGEPDHSVVIVGYEDRETDGLWYGYYTGWTETETVQWAPYRGLSGSYPWGLSDFTDVDLAAVPVPASLFLFAAGLLGIAVSRRKMRR